MKDLSYMPYSVTRNPWDPDELGNHRAVIDVPKDCPVAHVRIPWRRRDPEPQKIGVLLFDEGGRKVDRYLATEIQDVYGDFLFVPVSGAGRYYLYFMPYGGNVKIPYPSAEYLPPGPEIDTWPSEMREIPHGSVVEAKVSGLECVDDFNMFTEMELVANENELASLVTRHAKSRFLVFPEYRDSPIRMFTRVPRCWAVDGPRACISAVVYQGEFFVFQLGVYAYRERLTDVSVRFTDLKNECGTIAAHLADMRCFNTGGRGWDGREITFSVSVELGTISALWCGVPISADAKAGDYHSQVAIVANGEEHTIPLELTVLDEAIPNHGDDDPSTLSRLRWLDSDSGTEDDVVPPFCPIRHEDDRFGILGREITISSNGLPKQITSYFADDLNTISDVPFELLASPISFEVYGENGERIDFVSEPVDIVEVGKASARWRVISRSDSIVLTIDATLEFDGCIEYSLCVKGRSRQRVRDIRMFAALNGSAARYMTGLGRKGGAAPDRYAWKWSIARNQDSVWIGAPHGGVQFTFKDGRYARPLNTNFYQLKPLVMPESWCNGDRGGIHLERATDRYLVSCTSGERVLERGESLDYDLRILISPFKTIDTQRHFSTRYFHQYLPIDEIRGTGANTINIHHASDINPYINYPFLTPKTLKTYIDEAHEKDCRVKIYYTTRELTTRAPEIFALKSLGHEVFVEGNRGGHAWMQEHLDGEYLAAWYSLHVRDTSIINGILSRWHNFYVEGMKWLAENLGIDGVYIDDIGYGREIMKRVRRVLCRNRVHPEIDVHSANQYNERDGYASSANLYMEHFPYIDRLWFGEYFDYNENPDYWLVEISGLPFGLMGEMLQDGGNPWRGMIFGMTGRMPRVQNEPLWRMWDDFGLPTAKMIGFWSEACPVSIEHDSVKATTYVGDRFTVVAVASWEPETTHVRFRVDTRKLAKPVTRMFVPAIAGYQDPVDEVIDGEIIIEPGKGKLVVLEHR